MDKFGPQAVCFPNPQPTCWCWFCFLHSVPNENFFYWLKLINQKPLSIKPAPLACRKLYELGLNSSTSNFLFIDRKKSSATVFLVQRSSLKYILIKFRHIDKPRPQLDSPFTSHLFSKFACCWENWGRKVEGWTKSQFMNCWYATK